MRRHLFGPVDPAFADEYLLEPRRAGVCRTFGPPGADVPLAPDDTWDGLLARLPDAWRPEFVALCLPSPFVPAFLWSAPVPLVGLAVDWDLHWDRYRRLLPLCEAALADAPGAEALRRAGLGHVLPANLCGLGCGFLEEQDEGARDIDVLAVCHFRGAGGREPLASLARLADRFRVHITGVVPRPAYRSLLRRAKVVVHRSLHGECAPILFEAAACGALVFQEAGNAAARDYLVEGREYVGYTDEGLERLLQHYLLREEERRSVADAARQRVRDYSFAALWGRAVDAVERQWDDLSRRVVGRPSSADRRSVLSCATRDGFADPGLADELARAVAARPDDAVLHTALGLAAARPGGGPVTAEGAARGLRHFRDAARCDTRHPVVGLNLVEALVGVEALPEAEAEARRILALLDDTAGDLLAGPGVDRFPPGFDLFRVEWERAGWANAGRPRDEARVRTGLLRWRLHTLLAETTGDLVHYHEAAVYCPDLAPARAALGCALGRAGRFAEAVPHLRAAADADPFDLAAARALHQSLLDAGDADGARRLAAARRLLGKAAPSLVPGEPWFAAAASETGDLVSVVIPCCNEAGYTRLCLESVLRHTRPPYELVLIDNGSTDETPALMEAARGRLGAQRVAVVRNPTNLGFPKACNQGLGQARGRHVVFLNNDTVVSDGWLDGLVARAALAQVGLLGAVSNYAPDPQRVEPGYSDLGGLAAFAARRRREYAGQALGVERLSGFCLLATREALEKVGGFDERFGLGFFDDDDLCVRVREAGFRLLVALDVYVHHFGSRTFAGLGIDARRQLEDNFRLFHDKWGPERSAGYHLPGEDGAKAAVTAAPVSAPLAANGRPMSVSICLIVKNEESNLAACLGPVTGLVQEVVVVDTGSTDGTREVAASFGAKVFDFPWVDSFSAARNECLRHATGDWIFWLDADDRVEPDQVEKLRVLFAGLKDENAAYVMKCVCDGAPGSGPTVVDHVRVFRNRPDVRWQHRVHEQILPALRRSGADVRWADVAVRHVGYADSALRHRKLERDLRLLDLERQELGDHPFTLFNLGSVYQELGRYAEAVPLLRLSLAKSHPSDSIVRKLYALLAGCHRALGQAELALAACDEGLTHAPDDAELLFVGADLRTRLGDLRGAVIWYERLLDTRPAAMALLERGSTRTL
jgi:GT2 family glycosyltransferase/tetratricopeptide (TPR) repeat protein